MPMPEIIRAIEKRFAENWGTRTFVAYSNVTGKPPKESESWVRLTVLPGESNQVSMGEVAMYRRVGVIDVAIFSPLNKSAIPAFELAELALGIFRRQEFDGVVVRGTTRISNAGQIDGKFQINVTIPFYTNELSTN